MLFSDFPFKKTIQLLGYPHRKPPNSQVPEFGALQDVCDLKDRAIASRHLPSSPVPMPWSLQPLEEGR